MHKCGHILTKPCRKCTFKCRVNCDLMYNMFIAHITLHLWDCHQKLFIVSRWQKVNAAALCICVCVCALIPLWSGLAPLTYFQNFSGMDTHICAHSVMLSLTLTLTLGHKQFRWKRDSPFVSLSLLQLKLTQHEHPAQTSFLKLDRTIEKWQETLLKET